VAVYGVVVRHPEKEKSEIHSQGFDYSSVYCTLLVDMLAFAGAATLAEIYFLLPP